MRVGGFDERYDGHWGYEDVEFAYRMIEHGECLVRFAWGCEIYHQERDKNGTGVVGTLEHERWNKAANVNWRRICTTIP